MAIIKYTQDEATYATVTGRLCNIKFRESVGQNAKPMATFSVAYDYARDEFDKPTNLYMNCIAWGDLAEYIGELQDSQERHRVLVCGKLKVSEWNGESREQVEADFIMLQPTIIASTEEKKQKLKKTGDDFEDINF